MSDPSFELQKAVYAALVANTTLTGLLAGGTEGIVDGGSANYPYVDIGDFEQVDASTKTTVGSEHTLTLHVWSDQDSRKETSDILEQVKASLNRQALSVAGNQLINLIFRSQQIFLDADGTTRHGIIQFRAITQEN